jgi:hypothetical protein
MDGIAWYDGKIAGYASELEALIFKRILALESICRAAQ